MKKHGLKFFVLWIAAFAGFSALVMLLWNALFPAIFGISVINFWQAAGILILARILFGGLGGKFKHGGTMHGAHNHMRSKWMKMTPEQRQEFIKHREQHFHKGFCWPGEPETKQDAQTDNE